MPTTFDIPNDPPLQPNTPEKKNSVEKLKELWEFLEGKKAVIGGIMAGIGTLGMYVYPPAAPVWQGFQIAGALITGGGVADKFRRGEWKLPKKK